jgi:hypothetical protein
MRNQLTSTIGPGQLIPGQVKDVAIASADNGQLMISGRSQEWPVRETSPQDDSDANKIM